MNIRDWFLRGSGRPWSGRLTQPGQPGATSRWGDLSLRAASALVLVAVAVLSARAGGTVFMIVWVLAALAVHWEWQRLIGAQAGLLRTAIGFVAIGAAAALVRVDLLEAFLVLALATGLVALVAGPTRRVWAGAGMLYAGIFLLATLSLRFSFPFGARSIIWLFATVWSTDTFAYFGGRFFGGPKIWPRISPSKTWSGTVIGLTAGTLVGTFAAVRDLPAPAAVVPILLVTLVAAFTSQLGDAAESAMKRHFGVKDSSRLIPGHGGVMDRLDGFIAAAMFAFLLGLVRNLPSVAGGLFYWA